MVFCLLLCGLAMAGTVRAQTIDDGIMLSKKTVAATSTYLHDSWDKYWEGSLFRSNGNVGTVSIKTQIALPNFPSYVSGHSVFSGAAADVLSYLFPEGAAYFDAQKQEAAMSRLYGGIHFRSDIEVGLDHGKRIGECTVRFARTGRRQLSRSTGPSATGTPLDRR